MILDPGEVIATYLHNGQYVYAAVRRSEGAVLRLRVLTEHYDSAGQKPVKCDDPLVETDVILVLTGENARHFDILDADDTRRLLADLGMTDEELRALWTEEDK
jgi:hypothetical protein